MDDIADDSRKFVNLVSNFVHIDAIVVGIRLPFTITTGIQKLFVFLVFFGIEHIITFVAELDTDKSWSSFANCILL